MAPAGFPQAPIPRANKGYNITLVGRIVFISVPVIP
jgi:hypothetical protein